jgi:hypothetical protein
MSFLSRSTLLAGLDDILRTYVRRGREPARAVDADALRDGVRRLLHPRALWQPDRTDAGIRTPDPFLTMEVLYRLSYVGTGQPILARTFQRRDGASAGLVDSLNRDGA